MTRYRIAVGKQWLAAVYDDNSDGIRLTDSVKDACSWVTHEKALGAYAVVSALFADTVELQVVEEPNYPPSWGAKKQGTCPLEAA